jgi:hypothetical protein
MHVFRRQLGVSFDVSVRSDEKKNKPQDVRVVVLGEKAHIEFLYDAEETKKGDYALTLDGGKSFAIVSVAKKTIERQDAKTLQKDADSERDVELKTATASWEGEARVHPIFKLALTANIKQGIFRIPAAMNVVVDYTLAPSEMSRPVFNPMVGLLVPSLTALALKNKAFRETHGPFVALPQGFAESMTVQFELKSKIANQKTRVTLECGPSTPTQVSESLFEIPTGYKDKTKR